MTTKYASAAPPRNSTGVAISGAGAIALNKIFTKTNAFIANSDIDSAGDVDLDAYTLKTLFVDPPRSGLDDRSREFCKRFEHLLYISCNPDTLKRDLEELSEEFEVIQMAAFDQFPYTPHLEMGAVLKKRGI